MRLKRILLILAGVLLIGVLVACGGDTGTDTDNNTEPESEQNEQNESDSSVKEFNQEIVDNENVKATLVSVERKTDSLFGDSVEVTFEVENKRSDTIEVQAREVSADGKMIDEAMLVMSQEVSSGKKADAVLTIQNFEEDGELPAMEENIEMLLHIFSWDDFDFSEDHEVTIDLS